MSGQKELFQGSSDTPRKLARRGGPATSAEAAEHMVTSGALSREQERAFSLVRQHPGLISAELSMIAGDPDPRRVNRRLGELEKKGKVKRGKARRSASTGRSCDTWWPA